MELIYAVEAHYLIEELLEFKELIFNETECMDYTNLFFIYQSQKEADIAKELLIEGDIYIDNHDLVKLSGGTQGECYYDYCLPSEKNSCVYLYKDLLSCFYIKSGEDTSIQMFKYQLEEHLVYQTLHQSKDYFFIDNALQELILGTAKAYDIEVSFFDLDKLAKKI
ncbi:hypothetical protein SM124_04505 (plasmid) [Bacillus sp. 31A1R]|uniref:HEPN domain-containing protein n=1 Tax=Robertmurraya mangrovi TaxID=3098077 RepID=A0ABU5IV57_9BACI|nr:hypothetical protein [Bacillus sp. 31A1R]MDZ5471010.1 hypothetical protein [Bacillus sp. 31A1R]